MQLRALLITVVLAAPLRSQSTPDTTSRSTAFERVVERLDERTVIDLLRGRIAGARVVTTSGQPGRVPSLVVRNAGMTAAPEPLVVIDGMVTPLGLAEINVNDVDRMEVLKGAATAAEWGPGAANGVLLITTKRGTSARAAVHLRSEFGQNTPPEYPRTAAVHAFQLNAAGTDFALDASNDRVRETDQVADNAFPRFLDPRGMIVGSRPTYANHLSFGQRWSRTAAFASLAHDRDGGIVRQVDAFERMQARLNLDHSFVDDRLKLSGGAFIADASTDEPADLDVWMQTLPFLEASTRLDSVVPGCTAGVQSCYVPTVNVGPSSLVNPLLQLSAMRASRESRRTAAHLAATYALRPWLDAEARIAGDRRRSADVSILGPSSLSTSTFEDSLGDTTRVTRTTMALVARRSFRQGSWRARARLQYVDEKRRHLEYAASFTSDPAFPVPVGTSTTLRAVEDLRMFSLEASSEIGERLLVEGALSRNMPSRFGQDEPAMIHHRLGAGYRVSDALRLHAAFGAASAPLPLIEPFFVGPFDPTPPPLLTPFAREMEAGITSTMRRSTQLSYIYSRQRVAGFLAPVALPPSLPGGGGVRWQSVGALAGDVHELSVRIPVMTRGLAWEIGANIHRTRAKIQNLSVPEFFIGTPTLTFISEGERIGNIYGTDLIRTPQQLEDFVALGTASGAASDFVQNDEGYYVLASALGTPSERPFAAPNCVSRASDGTCTSFFPLRIGDSNPDFEFGLANDIRFGSVAVSAVLTGVVGGDIVNLQRRDALFLERHPMIEERASTQKPVGYYRAIASAGITDLLIESATHVKLRSLSIDWTLPRRLMRVLGRDARVGMVGRNLWTSGSYSGYDPDVVASSPQVSLMRVDRGRYPAYRTLAVRLSVGD